VSGGWFVPVGFTDEQHDAGTDADEEAERRAQTHGRHLYHRLHTQVKHNTSRSDIHSQPISAQSPARIPAYSLGALCIVVGDSFDPSGVSIWVVAGGGGGSVLSDVRL